MKDFWESGHADAAIPLRSWFDEAESAQWKDPGDVKRRYAHASIINSRRVVFNIAGNKYRLVVEIHYNTGFVYVRFIGTHSEYDKIDVEEV